MLELRFKNKGSMSAVKRIFFDQNLYPRRSNAFIVLRLIKLADELICCEIYVSWGQDAAPRDRKCSFGRDFYVKHVIAWYVIVFTS